MSDGPITDSKGLGRLVRVADPRQVWTSEALDFTPWLAQNIDVLGEAIGFPLTLTAVEVPVGEFRLDIRAETDDGTVVVIENQMERTDHGHLGQCLVYASGLEAGVVVWVAPRFREEFRRALDWLNERTDTKVAFFGVEVGVVAIGDGPRAPVFDVVARPNDFQKVAKSAAGVGGGGQATPLNASRQAFFQEVLVEVNAVRPSVRIPSPQSQNWVSFAAGPFGYWALSSATGGRLRVEAYLDTGRRDENKEIFDRVREAAAGAVARLGPELSFERLDDKRASRVAVYRPFDVEDLTARPAARDWAVTSLVALHDVLDGPLRSIATEVKQAHRGASRA